MNDKKEIVMAIGDLHCPFEHPDTLKFLAWVKKEYTPTKVVFMGDELDAHALSNFDSDPDGMSAGDELTKALDHLKPIYKMFPDAMVCTSNHTARPFRKAFKAGIPRAILRDYKEFLKAPEGWRWADRWVVDGIVYEHGEGVSGLNAATKATMGNMRSTVIGHVHSFAGIQYIANKDQLLFGFNVGCLIDGDAYAFNYSKLHKNKPIIGVGIIHYGVPHFIPMELDRYGRWKKKK